jgi:hypothetical protein
MFITINSTNEIRSPNIIMNYGTSCYEAPQIRPPQTQWRKGPPNVQNTIYFPGWIPFFWQKEVFWEI